MFSYKYLFTNYRENDIGADIDKSYIIPETIGQYTGLCDVNGKEIYEGDIINWLTHRMDRTGYIEEGCVEFRTEEQANIVINKFSTKDGRDSICNIIHCLNDLKVVGNIHDNPKLLKNE